MTKEKAKDIADILANNVITEIANNIADLLSDDTNAEIAENIIETSTIVGKAIAEKAVNKKIKKVVFDRNGYPFHGRVKAFADAAREAGLEF